MALTSSCRSRSHCWPPWRNPPPAIVARHGATRQRLPPAFRHQPPPLLALRPASGSWPSQRALSPSRGKPRQAGLWRPPPLPARLQAAQAAFVGDAGRAALSSETMHKKRHRRKPQSKSDGSSEDENKKQLAIGSSGKSSHGSDGSVPMSRRRRRRRRRTNESQSSKSDSEHSRKPQSKSDCSSDSTGDRSLRKKQLATGSSSLAEGKSSHGSDGSVPMSPRLTIRRRRRHRRRRTNESQGPKSDPPSEPDWSPDKAADSTSSGDRSCEDSRDSIAESKSSHGSDGSEDENKKQLATGSSSFKPPSRVQLTAYTFRLEPARQKKGC